MKKITFVLSIFLFVLITFPPPSYTQTNERFYQASDERQSGFGFVGGSSCCNCILESWGNLPADFPKTNVHSVTFFLLNSQTVSLYTQRKIGPTKLKLTLGEATSIADTVAFKDTIMLPVKHRALVIFKFPSPVPVGPGTLWKILDGDNNWRSAAIAHASNKPSGGLPAKHKTSNCQYARTEDAWFSVKFNFGPSLPEPTQGLKIVKTPPFGYAVLLNGKEIYRAGVEDLSIYKSYQIAGENVDVLADYAGGNICLSFRYTIINWRSDGTYSVSEKFGNCSGPEIRQEGEKLLLSFKSYTGRITGKVYPAETWEYSYGEVKKVAVSSPHPKITLQSPAGEDTLPQGNNPSCPTGFIWKFSWNPPSDASSIKHYEIRVTHIGLEKPFILEQPAKPAFTLRKCERIPENMRERWRWQVKAHYQDGSSGDWSDANEFKVASFDSSGPSAPGLLSPTDGATLSQLNNPSCPDGYKWDFSWNPSSDVGSGVAQYRITISRPGSALAKETVTGIKYTYESCKPLDDSLLTEWTWQVQAQDKAGNWGEWSEARSFSVESINPPSPVIVSPRNNATLLRGYNPKCGIGVEWKFDWNDTPHSTGIKQYQIKISRPGADGAEQVVDKYVTASEYTYRSCDPLDEKYLQSWEWAVRAQNNAGNWSKKWTGGLFSVGTPPRVPLLHVPKRGEELPQQNNPSCKDGYEWFFAWEHSDHSSGINRYQLIIKHKSGTVLFDDFIEPDKNIFTFRNCTPITDYSQGWIWQVRAISQDGNKSDWGTSSFSVASYVAPTLPSQPVFTSPQPGAIPVFLQQNNLDSLKGFVWTFMWQASSSDTAIQQYQIVVENPNVLEISLDAYTKGTTYNFKADQAITDSSKLEGWAVKVRAQDADGDWSMWSEGQFKVTAYVLYTPAAPVISFPSAQTDKLGYAASGDCPSRVTSLKWPFSWSHTKPDSIKQYWIMVERSGETTPYIDQKVTVVGGSALSYTHESCDLIDDDELTGWTWKVKVQGYDDLWSEWSTSGAFSVESYTPTTPVPKPLSSTILPQGNNPDATDGFVWDFEWNPSTYPETLGGNINTYNIKIQREGETTPLLEIEVTGLSYSYKSSTSIGDGRLDKWSWQVQAKTTQGTSTWSTSQPFTVESLQPTAPMLKSPLSTDSHLYQGTNLDCDPWGYKWTFNWELSTHTSGIKQYQIEVLKPDGTQLQTDTVMEPTGAYTEISATMQGCESFASTELLNWTWKVRAQNNRGTWSAWSQESFDIGDYAPSVPVLLTPTAGKVLDQKNAADCDGYEWKFDWEDSTHSEGIMNYTFYLASSSGSRYNYTTTASEITWKKCELITDANLKGWQWKVEAQANNQIESESDWRSFDVNALPALVATATATPKLGTAPLNVKFTGSATGGTKSYTYSWNFDDGSTSTSQNPSHTYSKGGTYTATLTVTDTSSRQATSSLTITPATPPLSVSASASAYSGTDPLTVNFTTNVSGGISPYTYAWNFGDGSTSTSQNPSHSFTTGTYTVSVTVTDAKSTKISKAMTITARISESTGTNPYLTWTEDNEDFKIALVGTGTLTLMDYATAQETIVVLAKASVSGAISISRKKPDSTWVELERKTYTAQDLSQKKSIDLSGPDHKYYHVHAKLCAWDMGGKTSYLGTRTDYHGFDSKDNLPSEFGGIFKILDETGALITQPAWTFQSNKGDDLSTEKEVCSDLTTEGLTKRPVFLALDLWENDHGDLTSFDTGGAGVNDDDQIYYPTWAHRLVECAGVSAAADNCFGKCYMVERDSLPTGTSQTITQLYMGSFSSTSWKQSNTQRSYFLIDDSELTYSTKHHNQERWYIIRHPSNHPDGYAWLTPNNFTVECYGWTNFYNKAYVKIRVWITDGK